MMKRTWIIGILLLFILAVLIVGCATEDSDTVVSADVQDTDQVGSTGQDEGQAPAEGDWENDVPPMDGMMNHTNDRMPPEDGFGGERPDMDDMQTKMLEACEGMDEGDSCTMEGPRGEEEGACTLMDGELACMMERPDDRGIPPGMDDTEYAE